MQLVNVRQGSEEWKELRARHHTASEAPAMMGASKKASRSELLRMKATGSEKEFSAWVKKNLLDKGHEIEAKARPIAEGIIGDELYPVTAIDDDGYLLASYDGLVMPQTDAWENKSWNEAKAADVREGRVPEEDFWQVVQHTAVGAERVLYTVSDGTEEKTLHVWYERNEDDIKQLMAGWKQFDEDLANYQHVETKAEAVAEPVKSLPAIHYELNGLELTSNLAEYREKAEKLVEDSKRELKTDQDFANAEERIKAFKTAEDKIKLVHEQVIGEIKSVDQFTRELGEIGELIRQARLASDKQVKKRKEDIRAEIITAAKQALAEHVAAINETLDGVTLPGIDADFAGAMKGKKKIDSLQDAVDTVLAGAKIEANQVADTIRANLKTLDELAAEHRFLFADLQQVVTKPGDDFTALVKSRIADHEKAEQERAGRIAKEEADRIEANERARQQAEERAQQRDQEQQAEDKKVVAEAEQRGAAQPGGDALVHRLRIAAVTAPQEFAGLLQAAAEEIERLRGKKAA